MKRKTIEREVTHPAPHVDEDFAKVLARGRFGVNHFYYPGRPIQGFITIATTEDLTKDHPTVLFLGVGGGPFDDHNKGGDSHKSCSRLMAEYLGVDQKPVLIKLLEVIDAHDKGMAQTPDRLTMPNVTKDMHRFGVLAPEEVYEWSAFGLRTIMKSEEALLERVKEKYSDIRNPDDRREEVKKHFFAAKRTWLHFNVKAIAKLMAEEDAKQWVADAEKAVAHQRQAFLKAKKVATDFIVTLDTPVGPIKMLKIDDSDGVHSEYGICFDAVSRTEGIKCDLFFMRNPQGNLIVSANSTFSQNNLKDLFTQIRRVEAEKRGISLTDEEASSEGTTPKLEMIHIHENSDKEFKHMRLYNGSLTRSDIEPLMLDDSEIMALILDFLSKLKRPVVAVMPKRKLPQGVTPSMFQPGAFQGTLLGKM